MTLLCNILELKFFISFTFLLSQSSNIISSTVSNPMISHIAGFSVHEINFSLYELFHFFNFFNAVLRRLRSPTVRPRSKMSLSVSAFRSSIVKIVCLYSLAWMVCGMLFFLIQSSNFYKQKEDTSLVFALIEQRQISILVIQHSLVNKLKMEYSYILVVGHTLHKILFSANILCTFLQLEAVLNTAAANIHAGNNFCSCRDGGICACLRPILGD